MKKVDDLRGIKTAITDNKRFIKKHKIELLVVIGSFGTDKFLHGESDIDIAFLTEVPIKEDQMLGFLNELSSIIKYSKLDLIDLHYASGLLKFEVATKGRLLYEKTQGLLERYRLYCYRYYYDTKKFRVMRQEYFENKLGELMNGQG
ncbi:MAG: hypothetical protein APF76_16105 [Desulfitibacter sp. BRH_c19]|nr:MAG: hypothetical protein APF76_16105 [Desulfitibacter sp. BRH_c19]